MWLKLLSSEDREEAFKVVSSLRNLGARVEVREWIDWDLSEIFAIKGRISELKSKGVDVSEWEKRIEIMRYLLKSGVKAEDFIIELFKRLHPELQGKLEAVEDQFFSEMIDKLIEIKLLAKDVEIFMALNNLKIGESTEIPQDPIVMVETKEENSEGKAIVKISYYPVIEVYVDVLSLIGADLRDIGENFEDLIIAGILEIVTEIISKVEKEEIVETQKLYDLSKGVVEGKSFDIAIDCSEAFSAILKSLEKSGVFRVVGSRVKMKGK